MRFSNCIRTAVIAHNCFGWQWLVIAHGYVCVYRHLSSISLNQSMKFTAQTCLYICHGLLSSSMHWGCVGPSDCIQVNLSLSSALSRDWFSLFSPLLSNVMFMKQSTSPLQFQSVNRTETPDNGGHLRITTAVRLMNRNKEKSTF